MSLGFAPYSLSMGGFFAKDLCYIEKYRVNNNRVGKQYEKEILHL